MHRQLLSRHPLVIVKEHYPWLQLSHQYTTQTRQFEWDTPTQVFHKGRVEALEKPSHWYLAR